MILTSILLTAGLVAAAPAANPITVANCQFGEVQAFDSTECTIALAQFKRASGLLEHHGGSPGGCCDAVNRESAYRRHD